MSKGSPDQLPEDSEFASSVDEDSVSEQSSAIEESLDVVESDSAAVEHIDEHSFSNIIVPELKKSLVGFSLSF